jgi:hypothetical protein
VRRLVGLSVYVFFFASGINIWIEQKAGMIYSNQLLRVRFRQVGIMLANFVMSPVDGLVILLLSCIYTSIIHSFCSMFMLTSLLL